MRESRRRVLIPSSAMVYAPRREGRSRRRPARPGEPVRAQQARAGVGRHAAIRTACRCRSRGRSTTSGRGRIRCSSASGFARRIADIEAGRWEPEIAVGNLDARRDLTDVRDTVRAYRLILEHGAVGRLYNVCSGRAIAIRELLDMLLARARVPIRVESIRRATGRTIVPLSLGDPARIQTSSAGCRRSRSSKRSTTCSTSGESRTRHIVPRSLSPCCGEPYRPAGHDSSMRRRWQRRK